MKQALRIATLGTVLIGLVALGAWFYMRTAMQGFSARAQPSRTEKMLAEFARKTAMPSAARDLKNPIVYSAPVQQEAIAHFADHCAVCHSNNGDGQTMFGKGLYPKPPDLRTRHTQAMTDGELFYVIENGIRMSGMPAFGGEDSNEASWKLVHFIRHLPQLTPAEEAEMEALNPKGPDEMKEEKEEDKFLNGDAPSSTTTVHQHSKGHHQ